MKLFFSSTIYSLFVAFRASFIYVSSRQPKKMIYKFKKLTSSYLFKPSSFKVESTLRCLLQKNHYFQKNTFLVTFLFFKFRRNVSSFFFFYFLRLFGQYLIHPGRITLVVAVLLYGQRVALLHPKLL